MAPPVQIGRKQSSLLASFRDVKRKSWHKPALLFMRGLVNEVGTAIRNHNGYIYIPDLSKKLEIA
jgi:hypothetical protein